MFIGRGGCCCFFRFEGSEGGCFFIANAKGRSRGESSIFVLDSKTSECLHYEHVTGYPPKKHGKIPREILKEHPEVEVRFDLIDCSIDVCSFEVRTLHYSDQPHFLSLTFNCVFFHSFIGSVTFPRQFRLWGYSERFCAWCTYFGSPHEEHTLLCLERRICCSRR